MAVFHVGPSATSLCHAKEDLVEYRLFKLLPST